MLVHTWLVFLYSPGLLAQGVVQPTVGLAFLYQSRQPLKDLSASQSNLGSPPLRVPSKWCQVDN